MKTIDKVILLIVLVNLSLICQSLNASTIQHQGVNNSSEQAIYEFIIEEQSLSSALQLLARQADIDILYSGDAVKDKIAPAISGKLTIESALKLLLGNTGLTFTIDRQNAVAITGTRNLASHGQVSTEIGRPKIIKTASVDQPASSETDESTTKNREETVTAGGGTLEEIIVTATKRNESLQDIPVSITAFTGKVMRDLGMTSMYDLTAHVPNLQFKQQFGSTSPIIIMRGVGNTSFFANTINPVGVYNDGVYVGQNIVQGFQLFDLERVEVLRGPQGTLFGRNTTGGLINAISRKPDVEDGTNGYLDVTIGKFGQLEVEAAGGMTLGEGTAIRASIFRQFKDGVFDNVNSFNSNEDDGKVDTIAARLAVKLQPSDHLDIYVSGRYGENEGNLRGFKPAYTDTFGFSPFCPAGGVPGELQNGCSDPFFIGLTDTPDIHDTQLSFDTIEDVETYGITAQLDWQVGDYTITSITAWDTAEMTRFEDDDGNILALLHDTFLVDTDFFSQELRITSNYDGAYNWIFGIYYYTDEIDSQTHFNNIDHGPGFISGAFGFSGPTPEGVGQDLHQESDSWAVFAEGSYELTDKLKLTVGLRVTGDEREVTADSYLFDASQVPSTSPISVSIARAATLFPLILPTSEEDDWVELSGRVIADYAIDRNNLVFVSLSRGFKGGEVNGGALFDSSEVTIADPEFITSLEIGYKGTLFNNTLQANITGFFMNFKDQQVLISDVVSGLPFLTNSASSDINGVEFEFRWKPDQTWLVTLSGAYIDAEVDSFMDPFTGADFSGNQLPEAPTWSFDGLLQYNRIIGPGKLTLQADWYWQDRRFFVIEHTQGLRQSAYAVVNGRISYSFYDDQFSISVFAKNIFDKDYVLNGFDSSTFGSLANIFTPGDPRSIGVQFRASYN